MRAIWKFPVAIEDRFSVAMPSGAVPLSVAVQRGAPQMWCSVDPEARPEMRSFAVVGTGHQIPEAVLSRGKFVGTFQLEELGLVFHLFVVGDFGMPVN